MVRGGRGYSSRGGGRGSSYRSSGSTYTRIGGSSRKSDFHESSYRGGGGGGSGSSRYTSGSYNSYDSRNRDKFPSRYDNRNDGKRSYRENSRDRSGDRKRPRQEDSRLNSSYTSSYRNRTTSRNRPSSPHGNYHPRGSSSSYRQREDSASRRHAPLNDSMGPPKRPIRSSYVVRPRGSGTVSRVRGGGSSSGTARGGMRVIRKESSDIRIMRRKLLLARQRDRARLIKIARLTSSLRKHKGGDSPESPSGHKSRGDDIKSDIEDEDEDEEEEEIDEDADEEEPGKAKEKRVKKKSSKSSVAKKDGDGDADADDAGKDGEESEKDDENEDEKSIKKEDAEAMDDDAADGDEDDDGTKEGKNTSLAKSTDSAVDDAKEGKEVSKERKDKERKEDSAKEARRTRNSLSPPRRVYIKLTCVHCRLNCLTFKEYASHLYSRMHKVAMRRVAIRQRVTLARMRTQQRNAQRSIEEKSKEDLDEVKPQFCLLCRLNYRQPKAKHQLSEHHKDMKKFLMPYCQPCHVAFKSPMLYEAHRCSLEHIKRKARSTEANSDFSGDEEKEVDLKNFMTVDSVGEIDDLDDEDLENHLNDDPTLTNKEKVPVGSQFIKKVEAFYCELCRTYNGVKEDEESYVRQHCGSRSHLKAFLRHREDESLQAKAERAEKKDHKKKEEAAAEIEKKVEGAENAEGDADGAAAGEGEEVGEDKLWEDVDKDLGDLLREVGPDEHDEEEEEEEDESVLNIDIESEKSKPAKEVNGKKEDTTPAVTVATPVAEIEKPKKETTTTPVVKVKKEKLETKASVKSASAAKEKDKKAEVAAAE